MLSKLDRLKQQVKGQAKGDIVTSLYYLIKELKCLPDILGREFEVDYDKEGKIIKIRQLPMSIPTLNILMMEMEEDLKRQEKQMKKGKRK